jgi:hypothetical protein
MVRVLVVEKDNREVLAVLEDREPYRCPALEFLAEQPKERQGSAKGFRALFKRYAIFGRQGLTLELFHEVDKNEKIWEFIKGSLRIFCYVDDGGIIVLSHGALKKSQKAASKEVGQAIKNKHLYLEAKNSGQLRRVNNE